MYQESSTMCSVFGYVGKQKSREQVLEGLLRLEYRGDDSSGFACFDSTTEQLAQVKVVGSVADLKSRFALSPIDGSIGIGHTRWATHGEVNEVNAHPHFDCNKSISLVHNGIIENAESLRELLISQGHSFVSQTDSEVIAHILERELEQKHGVQNFAYTQELLVAVIGAVVAQLQGAYAFVVLLQKFPESIVAVRKGAPLCIGTGVSENFIASDILAFAGKTQDVIFMPDESFALVSAGNCQLFSFSGERLIFESKTLDVQWIISAKDGHEHYMLKEIYEQRAVIQRSVAAYRALGEQLSFQLGLSRDQIKKLKKIVFVGCGTSWHAGRMGEFFFY